MFVWIWTAKPTYLWWIKLNYFYTEFENTKEFLHGILWNFMEFY